MKTFDSVDEALWSKIKRRDIHPNNFEAAQLPEITQDEYDRVLKHIFEIRYEFNHGVLSKSNSREQLEKWRKNPR